MRKIFFTFVFLFCLSHTAFATVPVFLSKMDSNVDNSATTVTTNAGTISGTDKYILCAYIFNNLAVSGTAVTINDTAETLTKQVTVDHDNGGGSVIRTEVWDKINPTDSTGTTTITGTNTAGSAGKSLGCVVYTGVHQTTPNGGWAATSHTNAVSNSVSVTTGTDELVVDFVGVRTNTQITEGAGQNSRVERIGTNFGNATLAITDKTGASPVMMSSSSDDAAAKNWATVGISLKPSVAGGGGGGATARNLLTTGVGNEF